MAIAALSVDGAADDPASVRRGHALAIAIRFALGHALLLGLGAALVVVIGWSIPPHVERGGELLGGALLIVMGIVTLQHLRKHRGPSTEHSAPSTQHPAPRTAHSHLPTVIGAAF